MTAVGILHPGAMGAAVGALLPQAWWAPGGRSAETRARAGAAGLRGAPLPELVERCDVLLSICPPHAAVEVAASVAGFRGLYCDANAVSPATALRIRDLVEASGAAFVDGGIVGGPPREPGTRLYLSGAESRTVAALFADTLLEPVVLGDEPGTASALKMCYAAWSKASAALLLAIAEAADRLGVAAALHDEWEHSVPELPGELERARRAADAKGWRWSGEMREIAATLRAVDQPDGFHEAAARVFERR